MNLNKKIIIIIIIIILAIIGAFILWGGTGSSHYTDEEIAKLSINMNNWSYDEENDIYYQIGVQYCLNPESKDYETLGIYVPGKYFNGVKNSNGTYTCNVNTGVSVGNYSAENAPIVIPVNTPGYSSQLAPTSYNSGEVKSYTDAGFIYLYPGCRGRDATGNITGNAPSGVTDLKAAVRYLRFNGDVLPGDTSNVFSFGHSGGGAQSAILGASGDSELYTPYLESIGAAMYDKNGNTLSDSIMGSMCWCPITSLDYADEAYEWNMGQYLSTNTRSNDTWTSSLSKDLAISYAYYINELGLKDFNGNSLSLEESEDGIYTSGSYYDFLVSVVEDSLNNFLNDTEFPYSPSSSISEDISGNAHTGDVDNFEDASGDAPSGSMPTDNAPSGDMSSNSASASGTFNTAQEYIDYLNSDEQWLTYDASTNTVKVTDLGGFIRSCKNPTKDVGAFDDLERNQAENNLFGTSSSTSLHFDNVLADLLNNNSNKYSKFSDYNSQYASEYNKDLELLDSLNNSISSRVDMYNPMYYLCDYYGGYGESNVAKYWRINSGIEQGDTALTVELNLALALNQKSDVDTVDFNTVWAQGHTQAERTGSSTNNFINWVNECLN